MVPRHRSSRPSTDFSPPARGGSSSTFEKRAGGTGGHGFEAGISGQGHFPQIGIGLTVLSPGEPMTMYHWETDQEDFLVLSSEALVIIEGEERSLRQWDFVHCPPETQHAIVGAGDGACVILAVGARERHTFYDTDGRLQGRDDGAPPRRRRRAGDEGRGRRIRTVSGTPADAISRRLAPEQLERVSATLSCVGPAPID